MDKSTPELILPAGPSKRSAIARSECCHNCQAGYFEVNHDTGECRLNPPAATFVPVQNKMGMVKLQMQSGWPPVTKDQFCITGFKPRLN